MDGLVRFMKYPLFWVAYDEVHQLIDYNYFLYATRFCDLTLHTTFALRALGPYHYNVTWHLEATNTTIEPTI